MHANRIEPINMVRPGKENIALTQLRMWIISRVMVTYVLLIGMILYAKIIVTICYISNHCCASSSMIAALVICQLLLLDLEGPFFWQQLWVKVFAVVMKSRADRNDMKR